MAGVAPSATVSPGGVLASALHGRNQRKRLPASQGITMIRQTAKSVLRQPAVGGATARLLRKLGAVQASSRVARLCGFVPRVVRARPEGCPSGFVMLGRYDGVVDVVARKVWLVGWSQFEPPLPSVFMVLARDADIFLDVGANTGFYSLLTCAASPRCAVHAFEPLPQAVMRLRMNVEASHFGSRVRIVQMAVADSVSELPLFIPRHSFGSVVEMSASLSASFRSEHVGSVVVKTVTLDSFVAEQGLQGRFLIKIDVEGQELNVLRGASKLLECGRPVSAVEVLSAEWAAEIAGFLRGMEYTSIHLYPGSAVVGDVEFDQKSLNQVLCPNEMLPEVTSTLTRAGITTAKR